jgi:hypothetical protein
LELHRVARREIHVGEPDPGEQLDALLDELDSTGDNKPTR